MDGEGCSRIPPEEKYHYCLDLINEYNELVIRYNNMIQEDNYNIPSTIPVHEIDHI